MLYSGMGNALRIRRIFMSGEDKIKPGGFSAGSEEKIAREHKILPILNFPAPFKTDILSFKNNNIVFCGAYMKKPESLTSASLR